MKKFRQGLLALSLLISVPSIACTPDAKEGFVPKNNLKIFAHQKSINGITEDQFNEVITKIETIYSPIISNMGATLQVERKWTDPTVNAYAQQMGNVWKVSMFGGLARHETITQDAMALVVCHELGHHIGGAPRKVSPWSSPWASNEGQSDYFATLKCLRRAWNNDNNEQVIASMNVPVSLSRACSSQHIWSVDYALCVRSGMAGLSVANLFRALRNATVEPKFETPDTGVVTQTNDNHPAYQCRLDTYFQGALCEKSFNEDVSPSSEVTGTCHQSTGQTSGIRPLCWFKPSVK
jgi:hypothetical protein